MTTHIHEPERVTYDVSAPTLAEVARLIADQAEAGRAEWWPNWTYDYAGDQVTRATVTVDQRVTMPRWPEYTQASGACREEWDRFWIAVENHEKGHIDLVRTHLVDLHERLAGIPVQEAQGVFDQAVAALNAASAAYDAQTDHGRNQGTVIDVGVGATQE